MSKTFRQIPSTLNLEIIRGDSVSTAVDFDASLVGHSLSASIVSLVSGGVVAPLAATLTDAANGVVTLSMTAAESACLAVGTYAWELTWVSGGTTRKAMAGFVEVRAR